jgi:hypothetical protein
VVVDDLQNGASGEVVQILFLTDPESAGTEPDGASVVVPEAVDSLQAGSEGLDKQRYSQPEGVDCCIGVVVVPGVDDDVVVPFPKSVSKYGRSGVSDGASSIVPIIVCDLQNGASGEVVQILFLTDPESAGMEPDGPAVVVPGVVDDLQAGSVGLDWQGSV